MKVFRLTRVSIGLLMLPLLLEPRAANAATPTVTPVAITPTEDVPFTGTVGTFTDPDAAQTASNFTSTIDWGDGTTTVGTVSGSSGSFSISGSHTYADEGSFSGQLSVGDIFDGTTGTAPTSVSVSEGDTLGGTGVSFTAVAGAAFSGTVVGNFTDTNALNVPGDFTATIDWGDGTTTAATISGGAGTFAVSGSHTYAAAGPETLSVTLTDDAPGTGTKTVQSHAAVIPTGFIVTSVDFSATEASSFNGTVATFTDSDLAQPPGNFTATIDWGDGTTTVGTIIGSVGVFSVTGTHTYADEGSFTDHVTVHDIADNLTATPAGTATVSEGDTLGGTGVSFTAVAGAAFSGTVVGNFTDTNALNVPGDFTATIDWGDGTTTAATISGGAGTFAVSGSHTYVAAGPETLSVTLTDDAPGTGTKTVQSHAAVIPTGFIVTSVDFSATEASSFNGTVATFTDSDLAQPPGNFTATIDWGDGTTTVGTIIGSVGVFSVTGTHTYADEGSFTDHVTVHDIADNLTATPAGTATVSEGDTLGGTGVNFSAASGVPFSGTVANFTDTDTSNTPADFTATIDWGDGATTAGTISGSAGAFAVSGTHTYASGGPFAVKTTLTDDAPGTASAVANGTASVSGLQATGIPTLGWPGLLAFALAIVLAAPVLLRRFD